MLLGKIFLTGSRSSQGLALVEIFMIFLFSKGVKKKKTVFYSLMIFFAFAVFLALTYKTKLGNYILMQITVLIDHVLGTEIAVHFGADVTTLNNSENYREYLTEIFKLDWLNPLLGKGVNVSFGASVISEEGETIYIYSVDNYYIVQYIKYAYPGLFSYLAYITTGIITMVRNLYKTKSELTKILLIGFCCYYINLWWVDALQTLKFIYVYMAIFFAQMIWQKDREKAEKGIKAY